MFAEHYFSPWYFPEAYFAERGADSPNEGYQMPFPTQDELYTVVESLLDSTRVFSFLGEKGMRLAAGEVVSIPGDLVATLGTNINQRRHFTALKTALANNHIRIRSRPMPILWDAQAEKPYGLAVQNGILGLVDPTYASNSSESFAAIDT